MSMLRSSSPAMSEISVGSPSPPPPLHSSPASVNGLNVVNLKRLKTSVEIRPPQSLDFPAPMALPQRRKSSGERVRSFSIADILGKKEQEHKAPLAVRNNLSRRSATPPQPKLLAPSTVLASIPANHSISHNLLAERLQPPPLPPPPPHHPITAPAPLLMLDLPTLHKVIPTAWDAACTTNNSPPTLPIHHFFPPALLHYEQRLAWDYQRQLQEHFQAQAQLLRQMSMDPNIIPSEDGSERSRSSSAGSQCYSPKVNVAGDDEEEDEEGEHSVENRSRNDERLTANLDNNAKGINENMKKSANDTPLDALFQLSTKNFDDDQDPATLNIFATRPNPKKKRKSRTAFTNHQIFELEKRFLYQKYLSPADRDEIAAGLGLSNAQVITWFQNRRAKLKRDMEELKKDVESVKQLSAHKSFLENVNDLSILKTRPVSRHQQPPTTPQHPLAEVHTAAHTHGNHTTGVYSTTSTERLLQLPAAATGNINSTVQLSQHRPQHQQQQEQQFNITAPPDTCNERRNKVSNSSGSYQDSLQTQQQNAQQHQQQPQQPRNLQINHSRG